MFLFVCVVHVFRNAKHFLVCDVDHVLSRISYPSLIGVDMGKVGLFITLVYVLLLSSGLLVEISFVPVVRTDLHSLPFWITCTRKFLISEMVFGFCDVTP